MSVDGERAQNVVEGEARRTMPMTKCDGGGMG